MTPSRRSFCVSYLIGRDQNTINRSGLGGPRVAGVESLPPRCIGPEANGYAPADCLGGLRSTSGVTEGGEGHRSGSRQAAGGTGENVSRAAGGVYRGGSSVLAPPQRSQTILLSPKRKSRCSGGSIRPVPSHFVHGSGGVAGGSAGVSGDICSHATDSNGGRSRPSGYGTLGLP